MHVAKDIFTRIFATVNHRILNDSLDLYTQDFSNMLYPKEEKLRKFIHFVANSAANLYFQKKLKGIFICYDSVVFCIKFDQKITLSGLNIKLFSSVCNELPISSGTPEFIFETNQEFPGFGLESADIEENVSNIEIFPFLDFDHVCFYTARIPGQYTKSQTSSNSSISAGLFTELSNSLQNSESLNRSETQSSFFIRQTIKSAQIENEIEYDEEESDDDFIQLGQRPISLEDDEEEEKVDFISKPVNIQFTPETQVHEEEEEETPRIPSMYLQTPGPTPEGVLPKFLSSSSDSTLPSSIFDYQSNN